MIFQKEKPSDPPPARVERALPVDSKRVQHSIISADLHITGDIVSTGDIKIDGRVDGNITCRTLTLGAEPVLNSKVSAETVRICGTFEGEIRASSVVLTDTAKVKGDIYQQSLEVHEGAKLEGSIRRLPPGEMAGPTKSSNAPKLHSLAS